MFFFCATWECWNVLARKVRFFLAFTSPFTSPLGWVDNLQICSISLVCMCRDVSGKGR